MPKHILKSPMYIIVFCAALVLAIVIPLLFPQQFSSYSVPFSIYTADSQLDFVAIVADIIFWFVASFVITAFYFASKKFFREKSVKI